MKTKAYNDFIVAAVLVFATLCMELTLFFFNRLFALNFFGIMNDISVTALAFFAICLIPKPIAKRIVFTCVFVVITLIIITDSIFSGFFPGFASISSLKTAGNLTDAVDMGGAGMTACAGVVIAEAVLAIAAVWLIKIGRREKNGRFFRIYLSSVLASVIALTSVFAVATESLKSKKFDGKLEYYQSSSFLYKNFSNSFRYASKFGYFAFRMRDMFFVRKGEKTKEDLDEFYSARESSYNSPLTKILDGFNVVTVTCETFDTRVVNKTLMPNLTAVMENSLVFDNYYVPAFFQGATVNTEFLTLTSLYPTQYKPWVSSVGDRAADCDFSEYSLPGQLKKAGYKTYYAHLGGDAFYSRDKLMPNLGFDECRFVGDLPYEPNYFDAELVDMINEFDLSEKFYLDMLTFSMHVGNEKAYTDSENYKFVCDNFPDVTKESKIYFTKAKVFDDFVGKLMQKLSDENLLDNTVVLFYPDHYMYMSAGGLYKDLGADKRDKEIHRQFMTMYLPQSAKDKIVNYIDGAEIKDGFDSAISVPLLGSSADITPTLLNLLTDGGNYRYFAGQDIFKGDNRVFFSDYTVFDGTYYISVDGKITSTDGSSPTAERRAALENAFVSCLDQSLNSAYILESNYFAE